VHHGDQGNGGGNPFGWIGGEVSDAAHHAGETLLDEECGVHAQVVAVLAVEVGGECAAALYYYLIIIELLFGLLFIIWIIFIFYAVNFYSSIF
jgi:hypothetical protein